MFESGHYGPARSLGISAREELGKFLIALLVGVGHTEPDKLLAVCWDHRPKQAIGIAVARVADIVDLHRSPFTEAVELRGVGPDALFATINQRLADAARALEIAPGAFDGAVQASNDAALGHDERARQKGLYVDLLDTRSGWQVSSPSEVTRESALKEIEDVERFLTVPRLMAGLVQVDPTVLEGAAPTEAQFRSLLGDFLKQLWGE